MKRLRVVKYLPQREFLSLAVAADVLLDTFPVGLGSPAIEL